MWINPETLELHDEPAEGLQTIVETPCPQTERLEKALPDSAELIDGVWRMTWRIVPLTPAEVAMVEEIERINARAAIPRTVSMRQARRALLDAGILAAVDASIAGMPGDAGERARIDWEYAVDVNRDWPLIDYMAEQLGLTGAQVDALFVSAASV